MCFTERSPFNVDSEVIPYLLHMNTNRISCEYNVLEGLLTSWVVSDKKYWWTVRRVALCGLMKIVVYFLRLNING